MKSILVPTTDVNSENGILVAWRVADHQRVTSGTVIAEVETSKAVLEVRAQDEGLILFRAREGQEIQLSDPIADLFLDESELRSFIAQRAETSTEAPASGLYATLKAKQRATELGVELSSIHASGLITVKDVEAAARAAGAPDPAPMRTPLSAPRGKERVLLIGAGLGATQVIDIFRRTDQVAVALLDDDREKWGQEVYGVPVVGGMDKLKELFLVNAYDAVVIAISTSVAARARLRSRARELGIPLTNAIDTSAKIATDVVMGKGNVICAFCHFGTSAVLGDNNFLSAYNSFDHHNTLGSDISTGPGCMSSGLVRIGNRVRMGAGVFIEPKVELGEEVEVASGAIIVRSVPAYHAVKTKVVSTAVVPVRKL